MADDIDTQLASMIERAPMTPQPGDEGYTPEPVKKAEEPQKEIPAGFESEKKPEEQQQQQQPTGEEKKEVAPDIAAELESFKKKFTDQQGLAAKERAERRAEAARREAAEAQLAQFQQQMQEFQARMRRGQNEVPDPEEDLVESVKYLQAQLNQERQQAQQYAQQYQVQQQQVAYVNNIKTKVEDFEAEFREGQPDYDEAANWLVDMEQEKLEMAGVPKAQAEQAAINWAVNMANIALRQGRNPAELAWNAANKLGWQPKAKAEAAAKAAAAAAKEAETKAAETAKMAAQKAGQEAAKTMSGGGAGANSGDDSLSYIGTLRGAAFDSALEKFLSGR